MAMHDDADMQVQLERTMIGAYVGSADLGEAIATAQRVAPGDYSGWYYEWNAAAEVAYEVAQKARRQGLTGIAGNAFLRASEYHRQSYFFLRHDLDDERVMSGYRAQRDVFRESLSQLPFQVEQLAVPFDPVPITGYVFKPPADSGDPKPTVLFPGGFDGTAEEMHKYGVHDALGLGWNAITFDGPGQGGLLVEDRVAMRPDFEVVLSALMDWVVRQSFVDPDAVVVIGRSLGGYLAPRGASKEHRIRALVCDPGQFDFTSRFIDMFSPGDWDRVKEAEPEMEAQLEGFLAGDRNLEFYGSRMAAMGAATFGGWLRALVDFTLDGHADQIRCPTLVTEGEGDFVSQSQRLYEALQCDKQFRRFSTAEGAGGHCEGMGQMPWSAFVFSWIAEVLSA